MLLRKPWRTENNVISYFHDTCGNIRAEHGNGVAKSVCSVTRGINQRNMQTHMRHGNVLMCTRSGWQNTNKMVCSESIK